MLLVQTAEVFRFGEQTEEVSGLCREGIYCCR